MVKRYKVQVIFILVFILSALVFGQDKQDEQDKQLKEKILAVYKSGGERGLKDFVKKQGDKISNKFIVDFAEAGKKERNEEGLNACQIMAEEKRDEKSLADVLFNTGDYFRLVSDNKKAADYLDKALLIYIKLNDSVGQGNVYLLKGILYFYNGDNSRALEMYDKALLFLKKARFPIGQGNVYNLKGNVYLRIGDNSRAFEMYDKALPFFEKSKSFLSQGNVYHSMGNIYLRIGENSKAFEMYDKALLFFEKAGDPIGQGNIYFSKGNICYRIGDNSRALEMYDNALPFYRKAGESFGQGNIYRRKGDIYLRIGNNSRALEMYNNALAFYKKAGQLIGQGSIYKRKGDIHLRIGENSKAFEMYDKALPFFEKAGDPLGQGNIYWKKGDFYIKASENSKAFEMYNKALLFFEKVGDPLGQGNVYMRKGDIYLVIGENSKAFEMYEVALSFFEKVGTPIGQGNIYWRKGDIYLRIGENSKAFEMYVKALPFLEKAGEPIGQGIIYRRMGDNYLRIGENSKAFGMYDKALPIFEKVRSLSGQGDVYLSKGETYYYTGDTSKALNMYNNALFFYKKAGIIESESITLHGKAKVLVKLGKKDEALELFEKGIANLEKIRTQTSFSEMKRTFMEKVYEQYEETVLFMLENKYYDKGFKYAEAMRSRVFLDQMTEGLKRLDKGLASDLKEKRDKLVAKLSVLSKEIHKTAGKKDENKLQKLKDQYRKVEDKFEELLINIRLSNPLYAAVRYPQPLSVQDLQKEVLKRGETLVRYFISPDKLYVFLVSKDKFEVIPIKLKEKEIKTFVKRYLRAIEENTSRSIKKYSKTLYKKLFKPLETSLKEGRDIIIIPDGELVRIPFETLIFDKKKSGQPVFLLQKYRVKYAQSASLLSVLRKHYTRESAGKSFIGFGDPVYDYENFKQDIPELGTLTRSSKKGDEISEIHHSRYARAGGILDRLPGSGEEVKAIAHLFEKESQKYEVHSREQASEDKAKTPIMKDFDFIHFACHALLNDDFQSLVLSQLPLEKSKEDGYFTLNEIMNCDYNAKLVVLSACQTGSGKMERAEGVTGLTRAVMYAGTPAVVASLWKVDDTATKELMIHFYKNMLEKNMDKVEALRQAKLELIKNKKYSSPLFWSAFVLYGE